MLASTAVSKAVRALIVYSWLSLASKKKPVQIGAKSKIYHEGPNSSSMLTNINSLNNDEISNF